MRSGHRAKRDRWPVMHSAHHPNATAHRPERQIRSTAIT
jgi:hypothetical protein